MTSVSTLLIILRGRLNAAQFGEDGSPLRDENRRPELDDLRTQTNNLQERHSHALRGFRQDARTLPGLSYGRLRHFGSDLNPAPVIIESEADSLRLIEETLLEFGSPRRLVQKIVNGERLEDWEERWLEEVTSELRAEAERLRQELLRRLALGPWWVKSFAFVRREPLLVTIIGGTVAAVIAGIVLTLVFA